MNTDTKFFTNEPDSTLLDRFKKTLKHVQNFDVLVGYFRSSGFYRLYESLESVDKIRILVGINLDKKSYEAIDHVQSQSSLDFQSYSKTKKAATEAAELELAESDDSYDIEIGIKKFVEFLKKDVKNIEIDKNNGGNGKKLEFRAFPSEKIHAKVYISRFSEEGIGEIDFGRVVTGSSNFSESGLIANREFNVELKDKADVEFALEQFEDLWKDSVDISREFVETVITKTWLKDDILPYQLYLKMLYEYFQEDINLDQEIDFVLPEGFLDLTYQKQAVVSAKKILDAYNGVFIADVVGLGKTLISALLSQQLPGGKLIICPPVLKEYWEETFFHFGVQKYKVESLGKLDKILDEGVDKFDYIFIDEAHRFRNEYTQGFEKLHEICFGKKVVLVSATPLNNTFNDVFSQLKLFQTPKKSTIPGVTDLSAFFKHLMNEIKQYNRSDPEYPDVMKYCSELIRDKVLKHVMVRRTRTEIKKCFNEDIEKQGLAFPDVDNPKRIIYHFDKTTDAVFTETIELLKEFKYARYVPLLYLKKEVTEFEKQGQRNIGGFMKSILVKRLESSFYAFRKSLDRFVASYEHFIKMLDDGTVLIGKNINVYDLLNEDNDKKILELLELDKLQKYNSSDFRNQFLIDLNDDLELLKSIIIKWGKVDKDPKCDAFIKELKENKELKSKQAIIFSESKETCDYLFTKLNKQFPEKVLTFSSAGGKTAKGKLAPPSARNLVKQNFDPNFKSQKNDIRFLITTDVLAEGINLHRSHIIINYDLPWNPTRVLQRVGRVNRVGTKHDNIYIYNFFPTNQSEEQIGLEENIKAKIQAFHDTLGEDAKYLTDEEVVSTHQLFGDSLYKKLMSKDTYEGEEETDQNSELMFLKYIRDIRDETPDLFKEITLLPKKSRTARELILNKISSTTKIQEKDEQSSDNLITFFRKGKLKKFYLADDTLSRELTFLDAVKFFECKPDSSRKNVPKSFYSFLDKNKKEFELATSEDYQTHEAKRRRGGLSNEDYVINRLKTKEFKNYKVFTDDQLDFVKSVLNAYELGIVPQNTTKRIKKLLETELHPPKILAILKRNIPYTILNIDENYNKEKLEKREIVLSEYLYTKK